jgi:putative cell wall-binding protein
VIALTMVRSPGLWSSVVVLSAAVIGAVVAQTVVGGARPRLPSDNREVQWTAPAATPCPEQAAPAEGSRPNVCVPPDGAAPGGPGSPLSTAVALSRWAFRDAVPANVLLIRESPSFDAVASGGLQGLLGGPLLLNSVGTLATETAAELDRFGRPTIHILGGPDVVPLSVEQQLAASGHMVHRHAGPTAMSTAISMAELHFPGADSAILVRHDATVDPLQAVADTAAVGGFAAARQLPVLLTEPAELSVITADYLKRSVIRRVLVVGDEVAVSPRVVSDLRGLGIVPTRVGGIDRFSTAVAIAAERGYETAAEAGVVLLVEGSGTSGWPSAAIAALHAARLPGPILLSNGADLPAATRDYLITGSPSTQLVCMPGVSPTACSAARAALDA